MVKSKRFDEKDASRIETVIRIIFYSLGSIVYLLIVLNLLDLFVPGINIFPGF
jgi:hypothetical protein